MQVTVKKKKQAHRLWHKRMVPERFMAYKKLKRLTKEAIAKARNAGMDAQYEKLDGYRERCSPPVKRRHVIELVLTFE
ncbi:unnamed protein product [Heligmosomoides polygyrus]|uniref:Ribosomal_L30_N domain-containing protein n=1 Tax=Heligmosomoides polygyrus TaxID=6339 RepID=A0A183FMQ1_HELPZ|nr:unnamed protein product [Heligmosomoides polygyrus]